MDAASVLAQLDVPRGDPALGALDGDEVRPQRRRHARVPRVAPDDHGTVELDLREYEGWIPEEMLGRSRFPAIGELPYLLTLAPRGWFWFQLRREE